MSQRVFDIYNEKDKEELFNILPDEVTEIKNIETYGGGYTLSPCVSRVWITNTGSFLPQDLFNINWHNESVVYRPIKEVTAKDIGKLCIFWNKESDIPYYSKLKGIKGVEPFEYIAVGDDTYEHCRRLTQKEWEELR